MIYLREFNPSDRKVNHPNLYPYNVLSGKFSEPLEFSEITVLYGNNGSGKSTVLNILANMLKIQGAERYKMYTDRFIKESSLQMAYDERGYQRRVPENSRYIKSEDILYEIKKIETEMKFNQEKYSNGETSMQIFKDYLETDSIYLLDEPEVSLSLQGQIKLSEMINEMTRFFNCQFIIATHSPLMLCLLNGQIYNLDLPKVKTMNWYELENVRFMYDFFMKYRDKFEDY